MLVRQEMEVVASGIEFWWSESEVVGKGRNKIIPVLFHFSSQPWDTGPIINGMRDTHSSMYSQFDVHYPLLLMVVDKSSRNEMF